MLADIDSDKLAEIRREWPIVKERRPDLYKEILLSGAGPERA